jgi:tetraacyldisaccharide 4'-kinase
VLVVGNRIVGGAGKTPTTLALLQALVAAGRQPGVVSRGHGRHAGDGAPRRVTPASAALDVGDEPLLMARRTGLPVWVGADRARAGAALLQAHPKVDVLLCDDGLQHLRLARDLDIIVFDERGAGNGWLLPAGPLREPVEVGSATPALVLYNAAQASTALPGHLLSRRLAGTLSLADWWRGQPARLEALHALRGRDLLICAGIGQPRRFAAMLQTEGLTVQIQPLADHHDFAELPWPAGTLDVLVTEKDAVKLDPQRVAAQHPTTRVWVVPLELRWPQAALDELMQHLQRLDSAAAVARRPLG